MLILDHLLILVLTAIAKMDQHVLKQLMLLIQVIVPHIIHAKMDHNRMEQAVLNILLIQHIQLPVIVQRAIIQVEVLV